MALEIERKFLIAEYPQALIDSGELTIAMRQRIEQTYIAIDERQELRVRKIENGATGEVTYTHTFKNGNGLVREEVEYEISEHIYGQLVEAFGYVPLVKVRETGTWQGITVELDLYDQLQLTVLETEFSSLEEAKSFQPPDWFGADISAERQYSNKRVWKQLQGDKWSERPE